MPPTNKQVYWKTPSFPNQSTGQQVYGKTSLLAPLSLGYKNSHDHAPGVSSPWLSGSWPTVLTASLASINLSFLHLALNLENSFSDPNAQTMTSLKPEFCKARFWNQAGPCGALLGTKDFSCPLVSCLWEKAFSVLDPPWVPEGRFKRY